MEWRVPCADLIAPPPCASMFLGTLFGYYRLRPSPSLSLPPKPKRIIRKVEKGIVLWRADGVQEGANEDEGHSWYTE